MCVCRKFIPNESTGGSLVVLHVVHNYFRLVYNVIQSSRKIYSMFLYLFAIEFRNFFLIFNFVSSSETLFECTRESESGMRIGNLFLMIVKNECVYSIEF